MNKSFIYAKNAPENTLAFVSTKHGGYSSGIYSSFNMGLFTNDNKESVLKNIELLKLHNNIVRLLILKQVHGNKVIEVKNNNFTDVYLSEGDGIFTGEKEIALGIFTADCFPVLLSGRRHIAALHCGWRSLNSGIIENALRLFKDNNDYPNYAYIGPGICPQCYEVQNDMLEQLNPAYDPQNAVIKNNDDKYTLNLKKMVETALKINNIGNCEFAEETTCCSSMLYSYRKDSGDTGRMLSVIMRRL